MLSPLRPRRRAKRVNGRLGLSPPRAQLTRGRSAECPVGSAQKEPAVDPASSAPHQSTARVGAEAAAMGRFSAC